MKVLVYGYGNPGRGDDGLGIHMAETIESEHLPAVAVDTNYQLNAEDALLAADFDIVLFIDASQNDVEGFRLSKIEPAVEVEFTTHAMSASSVMGLCEQLYNKRPSAYLLEIKGEYWEMQEGLSEKAHKNADRALSAVLPVLEQPSVEAFDGLVLGQSKGT